jgi:hypothetical protein
MIALERFDRRGNVMPFRPICCAAPLALMVGCADVYAHESVRGTPAVRAAPLAARDVPMMMPASLRLAPARVERQRAAAPSPAADPEAVPAGDEAPPDKTLALLSALGAMMLVIGRRLGRNG